MPNWCFNTLKITQVGEDNLEINEFINKNKPSNCDLLIEYYNKHNEKVKEEKEKKLQDPSYMIDCNFDNEIFVNDKECLTFWGTCPMPESENENWYEWNNNNWGTKWDPKNSSINEQNDNMVIFTFDTAWSPPLSWLEKTSSLYENLKFEINYEEHGCNFCGTKIYQDGNLEMSLEETINDKILREFNENKEEILEEIYNDVCKDDLEKRTQLIRSNIGSPIYNDILTYCVDNLFYDEYGAFEEDESENIIEYDEDHIINIVYFEVKKYCELKNQNQNAIP